MSHFTLDTSQFHAARRVAEFEDACTRICHLHVEPTEGEFASSTSIALVGGAILAETTHSACITRRSMAMAAQTGDNILLHVPVTGGFTIGQRGGRDQEMKPGFLYLDPTEVPGVARFHGPQASAFYLSLPRAVIGPAADRLALRDQTALTPQWRILLAYARALHAEAALMPPEDMAQCMTHLQDLAVLAIGAGREAEQIARGRGARVARLRAIRADIERNLTSPELSGDWMAARHGISARYLRALFADEGTSFADHVTLRRLLWVHQRLCDPASAGQPIGRLAMDAGFGDLSAFNARFRRQFGATPSDVRAAALRRAAGSG